MSKNLLGWMPISLGLFVCLLFTVWTIPGDVHGLLLLLYAVLGTPLVMLWGALPGIKGRSIVQSNGLLPHTLYSPHLLDIFEWLM